MYTGNEKLTFQGNEVNASVLGFWQWSYSELLDSSTRGYFAEYIVKSAIAYKGYDSNEGCRWWRPYDLVGPAGLRIEVKCSAYILSREQEHPAHISFGIAPTSLTCELEGASQERIRHSDVFVFCLWKAMSRDVSILDLDNWEFYVVPTKVINESKGDNKSITLEALKKLQPNPCNYDNLRKTIMSEYASRGPLTFERYTTKEKGSQD